MMPLLLITTITTTMASIINTLLLLLILFQQVELTELIFLHTRCPIPNIKHLLEFTVIT